MVSLSRNEVQGATLQHFSTKLRERSNDVILADQAVSLRGLGFRGLGFSVWSLGFRVPNPPFE